MAITDGLTPREVAQLWGVRLDTVYARIWAGKLESQKRDGRWLVDRTAVNARVRERTTKQSLATPGCCVETVSDKSLADQTNLHSKHAAVKGEA